MTKLLMPKSTAVWLIENTALTFEQISDFCGLHRLEVQAIADGEAARMQGVNPINTGILTKDDIEKAEKDTSYRMTMQESSLPKPQLRAKGPKYTPISKRQEKPDAIAWIIKNEPDLTDAQIVRLIGTTKNTIEKIRTRSHWNITNIKPQHPVALGLCSQPDMDAAVARAKRRAEKLAKEAGKKAEKKASAPKGGAALKEVAEA